MKLGFSGTRRGMTIAQYASLRALFHELEPTEVHHGDCVGADHEFAIMCFMVGRPLKIVSHPCNIEALRAHSLSDESRPVTRPLVRNRNIVNECDWLIAAPEEMTEQPRGGTWSTIRYARKAGKLKAIVLLNGEVTT